jgi:hypothetical protein
MKMTYTGVWGSSKRLAIDIDDTDLDEMADINEANSGKSDEQLDALALEYLQSDARRYRIAMEQQKHSKPKLVWDATNEAKEE